MDEAKLARDLLLQKEQGNGPLICSVAGSGGKTSTIYALSEHFRQRGYHCIVSTTTHIETPLTKSYFDTKEVDAMEQLEMTGLAILGSPAGEGKLKAPSTNLLSNLIPHSDFVFIEADGSRQLPLKLPANHEPVIYEDSDCILILCGLSALGQKLCDCCHRANVSQTTLVDLNLMAEILKVGYLDPLTKKYSKNQCKLVLNQAMTRIHIKKAETLREQFPEIISYVVNYPKRRY